MEFIALPNDIAGFILSRSGYGRTGLLIATATYVHPGWKGCLTLELENLGEVPIALRPGSYVGQLVLMRAEEIKTPLLKSIPVGPVFSKLTEDPRWSKLRKPKRVDAPHSSSKELSAFCPPSSTSQADSSIARANEVEEENDDK